MRAWLAAHAEKVERAGLARRSVGPAHPALDRARAADPVVERPRLSLERCSTRSRAARAISTAARTRRRPGSPRIAAWCGRRSRRAC